MTTTAASSNVSPGQRRLVAAQRRTLAADEARWLACAAHMAAAGKQAAQPLVGTASGRVTLGQGAGGDHTLEIDRACETAMRQVLEREGPFPSLLVSEELGIVGPVDASWRVVVDPLDGSLNAKRGLEPFGASIAVAGGGTLGEVTVGYVEDYTRSRCFAAVKGAGLLWAGEPSGIQEPGLQAGDAVFSAAPAADAVDPSRFESDLVEIVLLEAGRPDRHHFEYHDLSAIGAMGRSGDMRIRQIGSLALSLCYVAVGVADILVAAVRSRSVDVAAGLLILTEAGGGAAALGGQDLWAQPLDLEKRCAFVAWRAGLDQAEIVSRSRELERTLLAGS
jgi:myo-inositol-1(or 4)-monophosphatase